MHRLRFNQALPFAGNDVIVLSPRGDAAGKSRMWIVLGLPRLYIVFNSNHTSIMHRFRYNQVLPFAGNDVIVLSPLGGHRK